MHNAPSVTFPVGRSHLAAALLAVGWLAGAAATAAWGAQDAGPGWRAATGLSLLVFTGGWAALAWARSPSGELAWDGRTWRWEEAGAIRCAMDAHLTCALDLQLALLLRLRSGGRTRWLWVARAQAPLRWRDLRRAVYSRARPDALSGAMPPPAKP